MKRLLRCYPAGWRRRYGAEMSRLLDDLRPASRRARLAVGLDLLRGALDAHLTREYPMNRSLSAALRRGVLVALVVWAALSVEIFLTNVVFPSRADNDGLSVILSYLGVFAALGVTGILARRAGASWPEVALAGAVAGALIGLLTVGTFFLVDNAFLGTVSQQQTKIDGLARSGQSSMRAYVNTGLAGAAVLLTLILALFGAVLAPIGGYLDRAARPGEVGGPELPTR